MGRRKTVTSVADETVGREVYSYRTFSIEISTTQKQTYLNTDHISGVYDCSVSHVLLITFVKLSFHLLVDFFFVLKRVRNQVKKRQSNLELVSKRRRSIGFVTAVTRREVEKT